MKKYNLLIVVLLFFSSSISVSGQKFFRIKGEFTIKAKASDGKSQLTMGNFYYDRNFKKLVYITRFPKKETWVSIDTSVYHIVNNKVIGRQSAPPIAEFSMFHLALNSQLSNYGFKNTALKIDKLEKDGDMVITTWAPPEKAAKLFGKIKTSTKNSRLYGIVFLSTDNKVLKKQFFNEYKNISGLEFPHEVIDITYIKEKENYQVTTYKNIVIDDLTEGSIYNYVIPGIK
jgi:hypothetical protein